MDTVPYEVLNLISRGYSPQSIIDAAESVMEVYSRKPRTDSIHDWAKEVVENV